MRRFSSRFPSALTQNQFSSALETLRLDRAAHLYDLTQSNPTQVDLTYPQDEIAEAFADAANHRYRPHPFGLMSARHCITQHNNAAQTPEHVMLTASTSEAYSYLFKLLCNPGDAVLVPQPSYPLLEQLARLEGIVAIPYRLVYYGRWEIDFDHLRHQLSDAVKAIIVVSPNNPTGSILTVDELEVMVRTVTQRPRTQALIVDEVFADYCRFPSSRGFSQNFACEDLLTFRLAGLSKSAGLPQMKLAWTIMDGPPDQVNVARRGLEWIADQYLSVSTPIQYALPKLLEIAPRIREQIQQRICDNERSVRRIHQTHPSCDVLAIDGGWSAVIRAPAIHQDEETALALLQQDHVVVHPGYFYDFVQDGHWVVSLLPPPDEFKEGASRLLARLSAAS